MTSEKILEAEQLLHSLSDEMLKLKSTSKHYEETKNNLQKMCESIDKISTTHQKLTENMSQFLAELEKANVEGEKTREYIQSMYGEAKEFIETETSKKYDEIRDEVKKQTDKMLEQNANQSKALKGIKSLLLIGVSMEAIVIILIILTLLI